MLSVRVLPPRGVLPRALLSALEITLVLMIGHTIAGGELPGVAWIALMAAIVTGAGALVLGRRVPLRYAVAASVVTQVLLHGWLTWLTPVESLGHASHAHAALDPRMVLVHALGGLAAAVVWHFRARAVEVAVAWLNLAGPLALPPRPSVGRPSVPTLAARLGASVAPLRGPPAGLRACH